MTGPKWTDVERIYHAALQLETGRRAAFLKEACLGNQELLGEIQSLLRYEEKSRGFIEPPAVAAHDDHARIIREVRNLQLPGISGAFIGRTLGVYRVEELIGFGGMGEVYRAVDTRLNRSVVIKTLPAHLSGDPERQERFKREAEIISGLNHPHICMLYDVGSQDDVDYLVLEYIEGEALESRLQRAPLSTSDALEFAIQIADALRAAHRRGIVHRDLKPGNIMLTSTGVKLLDFGIAIRSPLPMLGLEHELCGNQRLTVDGIILGTPQYMSPEQLQGRTADARTDIFAFGAVSYEMFTGKPAFVADTPAGLISAILKDEPKPMNEASRPVPTSLERSVLRCLAKNPDDRWQTADDLVFQLRSVGLTRDTSETDRWRRWRITRSTERLLWALVVSATIAAAMLIPRTSPLRRSSSPEIPPTRFALTPPEGTTFYSGFDVPFAVSPDGRNVVFLADKPDGSKQLWLQSLYSGAQHPLAGTEGASTPFWSPDGEWVGFFSENTIRKVRISSGLVQTVANAVQPYGGAAWSTNDVILFPLGSRGLSRVSANGGPISQTRAPGTGSYLWPQFLRDGDHFIYASQTPPAICLGSLNNELSRVLMRFPVRISAVAHVPGYILFAQDAVLFARPFDDKTLTFTGEPIRVLDHVPVTPTGRTPFAVSASGVLAYRDYPIAPSSELRWVPWNGHDYRTAVSAAQYLGFALSPDSQRVIFSRIDGTGNADLWERNIISQSERQLTFDGSGFTPQWSPDGSRVAFTGAAEVPPPKLFVMDMVQGRIIRRASSSTDVANWASSWSNNRLIVSVRLTRNAGRDLWIQDLQNGSERPAPVNSDHNESQAKVSPDGRWIAYVTDANGDDEVWVASFSSGDLRRRVSKSAGTAPQWKSDGKELFYLSNENVVVSVPFSSSETDFRAGVPHSVAVLKDIVEPDKIRFPTLDRYQVDSSGRRFLVATRKIQTNAPPINIVVNWPALIQR